MLQNLGLAQYGPMFLSKKVFLNSSYRKLATYYNLARALFNSYDQFAYCAPDLISLKAHPMYTACNSPCREQIDGPRLLLMDSSRLHSDLDMGNVAHQNKILDCISELKRMICHLRDNYDQFFYHTKICNTGSWEM